MRLGELARRLGCELEGDPSIEITGPATIDDAGPGEVTFVANPRYQSRLAQSRAAAVIVAPDVDVLGRAALRATEPYAAFVRLLELFHEPHRPATGTDPSAHVAATARIGPRATIAAFAVVGEDVTIGADARLDAHVVIYPRVTIGDRFTAFAGAVVRERVVIGHDVTLQPGVVVGGDGFGYLPDGKGGVRAIPQTGTVILEDGVEIGANTTIDRPAIGETRIRAGTKVDNLVQIAHGVSIGRRVLLAAQVGIAGSTTIEDDVVLAGQVGVAGHLRIGKGVVATAQTGVPNSVDAGTMISGYPAIPNRDWLKASAVFRQLPALKKRVAELEDRLAELEAKR
jgi:UDP-3-O-[3-hydroxymyristoyl] glucosamine N-acyltransferase